MMLFVGSKGYAGEFMETREYQELLELAGRSWKALREFAGDEALIIEYGSSDEDKAQTGFHNNDGKDQLSILSWGSAVILSTCSDRSSWTPS